MVSNDSIELLKSIDPLVALNKIRKFRSLNIREMTEADIFKSIHNAWAYSSVQDKSKYNVCYRPEIANEILKLEGAAICKNKDDQIQAYCIAADVDGTGNIQYIRMNTDMQRERFPEFTSE